MGAISLSNTFLFSANIFDKSDKISFLKDVFISSELSGSGLRILLGQATRLLDELFSATEASSSPETKSATAFLFWLLVVILGREKEFVGHLKFFKENFGFHNGVL